jgi:hypothetical protein
MAQKTTNLNQSKRGLQDDHDPSDIGQQVANKPGGIKPRDSTKQKPIPRQTLIASAEAVRAACSSQALLHVSVRRNHGLVYRPGHLLGTRAAKSRNVHYGKICLATRQTNCRNTPSTTPKGT